MQLVLSTWQQIELYLTRSQAIIVPIGSTEQHGPLGLLGTDAMCAEVLAKGVGDATGALVGPTIALGMAHHHLGFPGTIALRPSTLMALVRDTVLSLADHGFRRLLFLNGHGGNNASVMAAFYEVHSELRWTRGDAAPDLRMKVVNWWDVEGVQPVIRELFGDKEGSHASPGEVSLSMFAHPGAVQIRPLEPEQAPTGEFHDARHFRRRFVDGRIGSASALSSEGAGKKIYDAAVPAISALYQRCVDQA